MGRRVALSCVGVLCMAALAGTRALEGGEPADLVATAKAWYAAIDAHDAARLASFYSDPAGGTSAASDVARFRGVPIEFGAETHSEAGELAWLQVHASTGKDYLSTWRRSPNGWKVVAVADLAPLLFLRRTTLPAPGGWPSDGACNDAPACVVYRLMLRLRESMPSTKELETDYFRPSKEGDRAGYGSLLESASSSRTLPEIPSLTVTGDPGRRTALGTIRIGRSFRVRLLETGEGWRIGTVDLVEGGPPAEPPRAMQIAALATARSALAAIGAQDAAAFARSAVDLSGVSIGPMPLERARARVAALREQFGSRFSVSDRGLSWAPGWGSVGLWADAPEKSGDWKRIQLSLVRDGDAWWVLDIDDGLVSEEVTQEEVVPR